MIQYHHRTVTDHKSDPSLSPILLHYNERQGKTLKHQQGGETKAIRVENMIRFLRLR